MARHLVLPGLVCGLIAASSWSAMAEDCSGFMCSVFGSTIQDRPAAASTPASAPAAPQPVADVADPADSAEGRAVAVKPAAKPLPTVTIAADGAEAARVKALAASLPKMRVRIVSTQDAGKADFAVVAALDGAAAGEKARLFTEQLHIIAGSSVRSLTDLSGKVVSFGPDKSPAQAAARKAFAVLGVKVNETPLEFDNALDGLATGDVAALVVLAPQPDARLAKLTPKAGLHLVSWPESSSVPEGSAASSIAGSAYPGLAKGGDTIRAMGVEAALDATGKGATGPAAKAFLAAIAQHSAALSKRGFDLIKADLESRAGRRVASNGR